MSARRRLLDVLEVLKEEAEGEEKKLDLSIRRAVAKAREAYASAPKKRRCRKNQGDTQSNEDVEIEVIEVIEHEAIAHPRVSEPDSIAINFQASLDEAEKGHAI